MTSTSDLRHRVSADMPKLHEDLAALVACKSVADPRQYPVSECLKAAQLVIDQFSGAGLQDPRLAEALFLSRYRAAG